MFISFVGCCSEWRRKQRNIKWISYQKFQQRYECVTEVTIYFIDPEQVININHKTKKMTHIDFVQKTKSMKIDESIREEA